ncbi:MAG: DNA-3-methyladenine glycosylase [Candidatus Cloacimonas sp. 4484_143]|nr:MAG: DNA-3-methyladenine glycosylase [Candidatus Cloacimonas sp. 4484_143]RLC48248.1 MAG: DNA-3-methyladenine glycosylase I [Candidatus Cloacimonadota bacterium]
MNRCPWGTVDDLYIRYHDDEWGVPVYNDQKQFEFLVLESAQAGLSWHTILNKRENYRAAYDGFNVQKVAEYNEKKIEELMQNAGIIRNRRKIEASVNNAKFFLEIQQEFGSFCNYLWGFVDNEPLVNEWLEVSQIPARTELSDHISKDMKKRGFKFLGSIIIYSHLQATGLVNDHIKNCFRWKECQEINPREGF